MLLLKKSFIRFLRLILLKRKEGVIQWPFFLGVSNLLQMYGTFQESPPKRGACNFGLGIHQSHRVFSGGQHLSNGVHYQLGPWRRRFGFPLILGHFLLSQKIGGFLCCFGEYFPLFGFCGRFSGALFFLLDFWFRWFSPKTLVYRFQSKKALSPPCLLLKNPLLLRGMCLGESGGISTCGNDQSQKHLLDHFPVLVPLGKETAPG